MSTSIYLITLGVFFGAAIICFGLRAGADVLKARAQHASEGAYRTTAEKAAIAEAETAAVLAAIQAHLAELTARLASVERVLKDVG
jgi:hypothetical protein